MSRDRAARMFFTAALRAHGAPSEVGRFGP
jgi:hypothetical protein